MNTNGLNYKKLCRMLSNINLSVTFVAELVRHEHFLCIQMDKVWLVSPNGIKKIVGCILLKSLHIGRLTY